VALGLFTGGSVLAYATVGGTLNNVNPGGAWPSNGIGRLNVDTSAASEIWTGLASSGLTDGYGVLIKITADGATGNSLTLLDKNSGSVAANQFLGALQIFFGQQLLAVYSGGGLNLWLIG
jgi:hypothetical protein